MISYELEIEILLDSLQKGYGYDFRGYSKSFAAKRISKYLLKHKLNDPTALIPIMMRDSDVFYDFVQDFSIPYTEMFRDPEVFKSIREKLVHRLKTYPQIKIWHIGCATGEEPYSMAILLQEEGLLDKSTIYATDMNHSFLVLAKKGNYSKDKVVSFAQNYVLAGGTENLLDYFRVSKDCYQVIDKIREKITFSHHNIISDVPFGEMNMIFFRNVMIYFDAGFQKRALTTANDSLCNLGFLVIGSREYLSDDFIPKYSVIDSRNKIFMKESENAGKFDCFSSKA